MVLHIQSVVTENFVWIVIKQEEIMYLTKIQIYLLPGVLTIQFKLIIYLEKMLMNSQVLTKQIWCIRI